MGRPSRVCRPRTPSSGRTGSWQKSTRDTLRRLSFAGRLAQRQSPGVAVSGFRQLAPIHHAGEESHVAVVNLTGQRILGGGVREHLFTELAKGLDQLVAEAADFDPLV